MHRSKKLALRNVAYCDLLRSSSPVPIPSSDIRWVGLISSPGRTKTFGLKSPLTNQWIDFEVPERAYNAQIPAIESGPVVDHYNTMCRVLQVSRNLEVFKNELKAYSDHEAQLFSAIRPTIPVRGKSRGFRFDA